MPLDSTCVAGLAAELHTRLFGARIDKIHMPARDKVVLQLRGDQGPGRLLLCAGSDARVHLTDLRQENPDAPPMLCMLLRKHLSGGRIVSVTQPGYERILEVAITSAGELGDITEKRLICEMTGRMTNLILVDSQGIILACLKAVGHEQSPRPVLPGLKYLPPPVQDKPALQSLSPEALSALCGGADMDNAFDYLSARVGGLAPLLLRECLFRAGGDAGRLARELAALATLKPEPYMLVRGGEYADFAAICIEQYGPDVSRPWPSFSALLDDFYRERTTRQAMKTVSADTVRAAQTALKRTQRKLSGQQQELLTARDRESLKNRADLITANLHAIRPGDRTVKVTDYFDPQLREIEITLDPQLTPQQNAQRLFKKYTRQKNAEAALSQQIERGEHEREYLENVLYSLSAATSAKEVEDIRRELMEGGYIRDRAKDKRRPKPPGFAPRRFELADGYVALCGRNNVENDRLTHRHAQRSDLWLHAKDIPGAHVIVETQGREAPPDVIEVAAGIAAYYSAGAAGGRVAVDYALARHVKKPQGARPGMVNYFNYKTVLAAPGLPGQGEE